MKLCPVCNSTRYRKNLYTGSMYCLSCGYENKTKEDLMQFFGEKEVQKSSRIKLKKNLNLLVFQHLAHGSRPSKICGSLGIKKTTLQYYLSTLKKAGLIKKKGYGVWEICGEYDEKKFKKSSRVASDKLKKNLNLLKPDTVRGHAFQFTLKIPKLRNWENREQKLKVPFKPITLGGQVRGQSILFRGRKVWLLNNSIIIYEKSSYLAETAKESKSHAINEFLNLVKGLERFLGADFSFKGNYSFKVSRQHYALVKNALAKQYDREGNKLEVYNQQGLWFLIDNSFNLHEAETVHPQTSDLDNEKVQTYFNNIKESPIESIKGFTPTFVLSSLAQNAQNLGHYAQHLQSHVKSVQDLGSGVNKMSNTIEKNTELMEEMLKAIRRLNR